MTVRGSATKVTYVTLAGNEDANAAYDLAVGAVRSLGLYGVIELVKDRATKEPLEAKVK